MNLFAPKPLNDPQRIEDIRSWVKQRLHLAEETMVMVTELRCSEPGCPPLETVIAVLDRPGAPRQFRIHRPIMGIDVADIERAIGDH